MASLDLLLLFLGLSLQFTVVHSTLFPVNRTQITLMADATLGKNVAFIDVGKAAIERFRNGFGMNETDVAAFRNEAVDYFAQKFGLFDNVEGFNNVPGGKIPFGVGPLDLEIKLNGWALTPFMFKDEIGYTITQHPNASCVGQPVVASGYTLLSLLPRRTIPNFGAIPAQSAFVYGVYNWCGVRASVRSLVPTTSNALGYSAEEYEVVHPEYGRATSHVAVINQKDTGRVVLSTLINFDQ